MIDQDYKVGDKFMLTNNVDFKNKPPYLGPFDIIQCWTNNMVPFQYGASKTRYNIHRIKPYTYDTNVEDIIAENRCLKMSHHELPVIYLFIYLSNIVTRYIIISV